jgi:hypothetical protein
LQKLKRRQNTKIIAETEHKYQITEAEGRSKYQILQKRKTKYHFKIFFEKLNANTKMQKLKRRRNTKNIAEIE